MASSARLDPPDANARVNPATAESKKRKATETLDCSTARDAKDILEPGEIYDHTKESFPDDPWYALNYERVIDSVEEMCEKVAEPLRQYAHADEDISDLIAAAKEAKKLPNIKSLNVAGLGGQGTGKSTLINAFLDRLILHRSGSSAACTSYATIIRHKLGADDNVQESDVTIVFLSDDEIKTCIKEQILRWTAVYPGFVDDSSPGPDDNDDEEDEDDESQTLDDKSKAPHNAPKRVSRAVKDSLKTAKEFFELICNTNRDASIGLWLENALYKTDISMGDFAHTCYSHAKARLARLAATCDIKEGKAQYFGISDTDLGRRNIVLKAYAPLIKVAIIETGHILLRHGVNFFDLPGYGDTSHFREAVVNDYRRMSDFEMVIVSSSRFKTNKRQLSYLDDSIHLKGANKTLLIMNQSDRLINEDDIGAQLGELDDELFSPLTKRWEHIQKLKEEAEVEPAVITGLVRDLIRETNPPFIARETRLLEAELLEKGVKVCLTSASAYRQWKDRYRTAEPLVGVKTSGIPALRQILFKLPATANFDNFWDHVTTVLPAFRKKAERVLKKHKGSKDYETMQRSLKQQIPLIKLELKNRVETQNNQLISGPWTASDELDIGRGIADLTNFEWVQPIIYYQGFARMLRENGIPTDGVYFDLNRNLNKDILGKIMNYMDKWNKTMSSRVDELAVSLDGPVQALLATIRVRISDASAEPALKESAGDALFDASQNIATAYNKLATNLQDSLRQTYIQFTSEIDIHCPIARAMKPVYERVQDPRNVGVGKGIYKRQRQFMRVSIVHPQQPDRHHEWLQPLQPLFDTLREQVIAKQTEDWTGNCNTFIEEVDAQLQNFLKITSDLLKKDTHVSQEHRNARRLLKKLLEDFDASLLDIQSRFTDLDGQPLKKRIKLEDLESEPMEACMAPLSSDRPPEFVYITQNEKFFNFVSNMWPLSGSR